MAEKETPLMKQYKEIKSKYIDYILFFRLGDFYEMFFEDAVISSKELGLTLTSRNKEKDQEVPLAGIPYHSSASYISKLVNKGYKVAICEQMEDPSSAKGIVRREVVKIITPGTIIDVDTIDDKSNNYLMGLRAGVDSGAVALIDITTGEFRTAEFSGDRFGEKIINELYKANPREVVVDSATAELFKKDLADFSSKEKVLINEIHRDDIGNAKESEEILKGYFKVVSLESYGLEGKKEAIAVCSAALSYVLNTQKNGELPINKIVYYSTSNFMELNLSTQKNLELTENTKNNTDFGTLLWVLDDTRTAMGGRMIKKFIKNPLINKQEIEKRQLDVKFYIDNIIIREEVKEYLKDIYDIERLIGKIILGTENGKDLTALKKSIRSVKEIAVILENTNVMQADKEGLEKLYQFIDSSINDDSPFSIREGGMIKRGYNAELDELFNISSSGKDYILELEQKERENSGIKSLKVGFNKVFGYYIEVTRPNLHLVPDYFIRKQTVATGERFITQELKEYENKVLNAKEKIEALEYELFKEISGKIKEQRDMLQNAADEISYIDVLISFADAAIKNNYIKPEITDGFELDIEDARHPVVEKLVGLDDFVKNSVKFDDRERIMILTGPNMAGKSTFMKQLALIILMAQMGSYVPSSRARIGLVDKVFTRVGASDDIVSGQSTFMVEMSEVANIMNNATERSFIILDEVGRGTSTFDGISIAWAITEHLSESIKAKTIFATHYHELTEIEKNFSNIVNFRVEVKETEDEVIFLRKIVRGGADKSYGIEVAKLAGLPNGILARSRKILMDMERKKEVIEKKLNVRQLSLFDYCEPKKEPEQVIKKEDTIITELRNIDLNNMTPIDALNKLNELKKKL